MTYLKLLCFNELDSPGSLINGLHVQRMIPRALVMIKTGKRQVFLVSLGQTKNIIQAFDSRALVDLGLTTVAGRSSIGHFRKKCRPHHCPPLCIVTDT